MTDNQSDNDRGRFAERFERLVGRRRFIAAGSGLSAALVAGCTSENTPTADSSDDSTADGEADESTLATEGANFRLLVSDLPADIGDFDRLDISFDSARIFDGGTESDDEPAASNETDEPAENADDEAETEDDGAEAKETADGTNPGAEDESEREEAAESVDETATETSDGIERRRGFYVLDLEDATVDLTKLIGERATSVFEGELSAGSYRKIELHVSDIEGIVDGERVAVKVPSEKLQITHPFEIGADEPVDFVFDINVVKRGKKNGYNLKPVISESGVAGEDVEVEEVDDDREDGSGTDAENEESEAAEASEEPDDENGTDEDADTDEQDGSDE